MIEQIIPVTQGNQTNEEYLLAKLRQLKEEYEQTWKLIRPSMNNPQGL
jgi:hypothetical protein